MTRKTIEVKEAKKLWTGMDEDTSYGTWTYATEARQAGLLFLAGAVPLDEKGNLVGKGDMKRQIEQVVSNMENVLEAAGLTSQNIINMRVYTTDIAEFVRLAQWRCSKFPRIWGRKLGDQTSPSATVVEVRRLAGKDFLLEIEVVAETVS